MSASIFWDLIEKSTVITNGNVENQISFLIDKLSTMNENSIVGFELKLRELIKKSDLENVILLLKNIENHVTDDLYLYFRCRLILYGKDLFNSILSGQKSISKKLDNDAAAELLLSLADEAFIKKFGENNQKELPSEIGNEYLDYNNS